MNELESLSGDLSIRKGYEDLGVESYYIENRKTYLNPHENKIHYLMDNFFDKYLNLDKDSKILDLCCGSGEITRFLQEKGYYDVTGLDPFTYDLYKEKTNKECINLNFKDIASGKLKGEYDLIICSFALHLAETSMLPNILYNLSEISKELVIITPHKKPEIKDFFELDLELYYEKVRLRHYKTTL